MSEAAQLQSAAADIGRALDADTALQARALNLNVEDACKVYKTIKGPLELALTILEKLPIPNIGNISAGIRVLIKIADQVCPA